MMRNKSLAISGFAAVLLATLPALAITWIQQGTSTNSDSFRIYPRSDVGSTNNSGDLVFGSSTGQQLAIDNNEIRARAAGGGISTLYLQHGGGALEVGGDLFLDGDFTLWGEISAGGCTEPRRLSAFSAELTLFSQS